jgi:antitoxin CptB
MNAPPRSAFGAPPQGGAASGPAEPDPRRALDCGPLRLSDLNRLKWRCRRGMLENDLFIERFFRRHEATLSASQASGLQALMELADNDLLDLLLARSEPDTELDSTDVRLVLAQMRTEGRPS